MTRINPDIIAYTTTVAIAATFFSKMAVTTNWPGISPFTSSYFVFATYAFSFLNFPMSIVLFPNVCRYVNDESRNPFTYYKHSLERDQTSTIYISYLTLLSRYTYRISIFNYSVSIPIKAFVVRSTQVGYHVIITIIKALLIFVASFDFPVLYTVNFSRRFYKKKNSPRHNMKTRRERTNVAGYCYNVVD